MKSLFSLRNIWSILVSVAAALATAPAAAERGNEFWHFTLGRQRMRYPMFFMLAILTLFSTTSLAVQETDLSIIEVGSWVENGDEMLYLRVDRPLTNMAGCPTNNGLIKVLLKNAQESNVENVRSIALAALLSGNNVTLGVHDSKCVYNHPTIETIWIGRR